MTATTPSMIIRTVMPSTRCVIGGLGASSPTKPQRLQYRFFEAHFDECVAWWRRGHVTWKLLRLGTSWCLQSAMHWHPWWPEVLCFSLSCGIEPLWVEVPLSLHQGTQSLQWRQLNWVERHDGMVWRTCRIWIDSTRFSWPWHMRPITMHMLYRSRIS